MWKFAYIISKLENIGSFIIIFKQHSDINQIIKKYSIIFLFSGFVISLIIGILYTIVIILFREYNISNYLLIGMVEAVIMILPITYKTFHLPYNNYKAYNESYN